MSKNDSLYVFMRTWIRAYVHGLHSYVRDHALCVHRLVQAYTVLNLCTCAKYLRMQTQACVHMLPVKYPILTPVSPGSYSNANLTPFFHPFVDFAPFSGRGSTNRVAAWYRVLTAETRAHICVTGFEPIILLLPERFASAILVQTLAEKWWDTTHTFHIANREMTLTPYDFHRMTVLRCDGALINLEGEWGKQLGIDLFRRRYTTQMICYFDIKVDYRPLLQVTADDYAKMDEPFLLYLLEAYLSTSGGQTVSLRWLALFRDFGETPKGKWGRHCRYCILYPL